MRVYKFRLQVNLNKPCSTKPTNDFNTAKKLIEPQLQMIEFVANVWTCLRLNFI